MVTVLRIGLCGAGGTGKGTLMYNLVKEMSTPIVPIHSSVEHIGKLLKPDSKSFKEFSDEERVLFQYSIVSAQIQNENFLRNRGESYISERSIFDYLAYWEVNNGDEDGYQAFKNYVFSAFHNNPYDVIFFLPIEFKPTDTEESSWKERDEESRKRRDEILHNIVFATLDSHVYTLSGSVEDRVAMALDYLRRDIHVE